MVSKDKILRICDVCHMVELEDNKLLPKTNPVVIELLNRGYFLSHSTLSRQCAKDFFKEDFAEIAETYVPGLNEDNHRIYEKCE